LRACRRFRVTRLRVFGLCRFCDRRLPAADFESFRYLK
jgi:hypothetical protein